MPLNLSKTVLECLKGRPEEKMTARQIAEWIMANHPEEAREKKQDSRVVNTDVELVQQWAAEISSQRPRLQKRHLAVKTTEGLPRKYYYSEKSDDDEVTVAEEMAAVTSGAEVNKAQPCEHDLYPLLSRYLRDEFGVYSKRIDEKHSSNKHGPKGNRWLYPDVVGMEDLGADWRQEVRDCAKQYSDKRTKLWSFEVKRLINRSNVRECYFQSLSNSSWANLGYLVTAEIEGQDTVKELRMLFAAHGIGLIRLNPDDPGESDVLIPAREKSAIDWNAANRLAAENSDFLGYLDLVKQFYQTGKVRESDWDAPKS